MALADWPEKKESEACFEKFGIALRLQQHSIVRSMATMYVTGDKQPARASSVIANAAAQKTSKNHIRVEINESS